jgi:hypothetical protein
VNKNGSFAARNGYARLSNLDPPTLRTPLDDYLDETEAFERKDSAKTSSSLGWTQQPWKSS